MFQIAAGLLDKDALDTILSDAGKIFYKEIKEHKLLKEFSFTAEEIINMCNDDLSLDELYHQKKKS